jgi:FkbM family methyltransferase
MYILRNKFSSFYRRLLFFYGLFKTPYHFSLNDILANPFKQLELPKIDVLFCYEDWLHLKIKDFRFYWPAKFNTSELPWLYNEVFTELTDNPHAYEFDKVQIQEGDWVIDGGACEGFFTAYALSRGARVLAIEPIKELCEGLSKTFADEIGTGHVRILQGCIGANDGMTNINFNPKSICQATTANKSEYTEYVSEVRVYTIDTIIKEGFIPNINFIKFDIEGDEVKALIGSEETLREFNPKLAVAVYHDLYNAVLCKQFINKINPNLIVHYRGIYGCEKCIPRPYMVFSYPSL